MASVSRTEIDDLAQQLIKLFGSQVRRPLIFSLTHQTALLPFISRVVQFEVTECDTDTLVLRRNSVASKLITGKCVDRLALRCLIL